MLQTFQLGSAQPGTGQGNFLFQAVGAAIIGGVALNGGAGSIYGTFVGATILAVLNNGLVLSGIDPGLGVAVTGALIVIASACSRRAFARCWPPCSPVPGSGGPRARRQRSEIAMPAPASAAEAGQRSAPAARQAPARSPDRGIRQVSAKARPAKPANVIDRQSCIPLYAQVAEQIEAAIKSGVLYPGDRIASDNLTEMLGLARSTLCQALQTLVDRGLLLRQRGVGTFVSPVHLRRAVKLCSL